MWDRKQEKDRPDFSKMSASDKIKWFFYYYKWAVFIAIAVVIAIVATVLSYAGRKEPVLNIMAINAEPMEDHTDFWDDFLIEHGFDPEKQAVMVDANLKYLGGEGYMDVYSIPAIGTILNAGNADVFICDEACFETLGSLGAFTPIEELFPGEEVEPYEDRIVYVDMDRDAEPYYAQGEAPGEGHYARGIRLNKDSLIYDTELYSEDTELIVALPWSADHALLGKDMIIELLGD